MVKLLEMLILMVGLKVNWSSSLLWKDSAETDEGEIIVESMMTVVKSMVVDAKSILFLLSVKYLVMILESRSMLFNFIFMLFSTSSRLFRFAFIYPSGAIFTIKGVHKNGTAGGANTRQLR